MKNTLLDQYIKASTNNCLKNKKCINLDLIISGGGFNGAYGYGCLLFLKEIQNQNRIRINRISGASIGAILGLIFFTDPDINFIKEYIKIQNNWRKKGNLNNVKSFISRFIFTYFKSDDKVKILDNKLYINRINIENGKEEVICKFKSRDQLVDCILCSSFIPYITNGQKRYKKKYIDGIYPYLFKDKKNKSLFINNYNKLHKMLTTKNENNPTLRIIEGALDISLFFKFNKSNMCSWLHEWNILDFIMYRIIHFLLKIFLVIIDYFHFNKILEFIKNFNYKLHIITKNLIINLMKDILFLIN